MKFEKSAGVILFRPDGVRMYLLLENKGKWGFPKGNVETGESDLNAALRECGEETGIKKIRIIQNFAIDENYFYRDIYTGSNELVKKKVVWFLGETSEKKVNISSEHDDFKWLDYEDALGKLKGKGRRTLNEAETFLKTRSTLDKWS